MALKAPFPWFGGKSRAASLIWERFGDVANYVEPFAGSLAVLLARPTAPRVETVNDLDCYLANFWRALAANPQEVAKYADWPVNEADLNARHRWLVGQDEFRERIRGDPSHYDVKIAGWWVWGLSQWIGDGWCRQAGHGSNYHSTTRLPHLGNPGRGVHRSAVASQLPRLDGTGDAISIPGKDLYAYLEALSLRLRRVRVACGEWRRILTPSVLRSTDGKTGVLLDPPYVTGNVDYAAGGTGTRLSADVCAWAVAHGNDPSLRIALCGYEGEHKLPGWECVEWQAAGGYGNRNKQNDNKYKERIWFSASCLRSRQGTLL